MQSSGSRGLELRTPGLAHDTSRGLNSDSGVRKSPPSVPHSTQSSLLTSTSLLRPTHNLTISLQPNHTRQPVWLRLSSPTVELIHFQWQQFHMAYHLPQNTISAQPPVIHSIYTQERNDCKYYATYTNKPTDSSSFWGLWGTEL